MNPRQDISSRTARRRATWRLHKLDNQFQEIIREVFEAGRDAGLERAFSILKEMRGIVRNADYTKTARREWLAKINLNEARLEEAKQFVLEKQPERIHELISALLAVIAEVKIGNAQSRDVWWHVTQTDSFLVNTQPSVHRTKGRQLLDEAVRGFRLWLRQRKERRRTDQS